MKKQAPSLLHMIQETQLPQLCIRSNGYFEFHSINHFKYFILENETGTWAITSPPVPLASTLCFKCIQDVVTEGT